MNWKGGGRKRAWPVQVLSRHLLARTEEEYEKPVGIAGLLTEVVILC
jgi:hypothetical protein